MWAVGPPGNGDVTGQMSELLVESVTVADAPPVVRDEPDYQRAFWRWGAGTYLLSTLALFLVGLSESGGKLVFLIDDTAIHLSLARNLAHHGTWGPVAHHFQSASSSPVWTVLLAGFVGFTSLLHHVGIPLSDTVGPIVLNVAAGLWAIRILASQQRILLPSWRRPLDALAVVALVVFVLFLPGLTMLGMEHTLHVALVMAIVVLFQRKASGQPLGWPRWLPYALLAVATLVRMETTFVAAGLGIAFLAQALPGGQIGDERPRFSHQLRLAIGVGAASAIPLAAFAAFNHLMGQGLLPNSVLAKGQGLSNDTTSPLNVTTVLHRLTTDPLVAVIAVVGVGALVIGWGQRRRSTFGLITLLAAIAVHVTLAQIGWFERYQAYLIGLGVLVFFGVADEALPAVRRAPRRAYVAPMLVLVALALCITKVNLTVDVGRAVADTYQQRYQAGRFLARYYDGQPVASGELGYISLFHKGPMTDIFGLGDYEVLQARRATDQNPGQQYWADLAKRRGFKVAAVYPSNLLLHTPKDWILVGTWTMHHDPVTALEPTFQFWATTPGEVAPLTQHLREFQSQMPSGSTLEIQPLASYRAQQQLAGH
jgi:hypothetical protein